jgi:hypothetical protein
MTTFPNLIGTWVDVRSFAPPNYPSDGQQDWQPYIQAAVDYIINQSLINPAPTKVATLYFPPGRYRINAPIVVSQKIPETTSSIGKRYTYCSIQIMGDAPPYGDGFNAAAIIPNFSDRPALCIELGRAVKIQNLAFHGLNTWVETANPRDIVTHYNDNNYIAKVKDEQGNYIDISVRDETYSPYAAICIDPFTRYTDPMHPLPPDGGYPGMENYYLPAGDPANPRSGSSSIQIENCTIYGFIVGIAISPNGLTQNAENIAITNCSIASVKTAIAICQDQSRNVILQNLSVEGAKYAINCTDYGKGTGNCPSIFGANIGGVKYIFKTFSFASTPSINGLYCEACLSIGILGGGGTADGYVFNSCNFALIGTPSKNRVPTKPSIFRLINMARAVFNGCSIGAIAYIPTNAISSLADNLNDEPLWLLSVGSTTFNNCTLGVRGSDAAPRFWVAGNTWNVVFNECYTFDIPYDITQNPPTAVSPQSSGRISQIIKLQYSTNLLDDTVLPGAFMYWQDDSGGLPTQLRWIDSKIPYVVLQDVEVTVNNDGTGNFFLPKAAIGLVALGDIIESHTEVYNPVEQETTAQKKAYDINIAMQLGRVVDINPETYLVTLHYVSAGATSQTHKYLFARYLPRIHYSTTGDFNPSQPDRIINVSHPGLWRKNERIRDANGHILEGTYIKEILGNTFILSRPFTGSQANKVALYDAKVFQMNTTQVF